MRQNIGQEMDGGTERRYRGRERKRLQAGEQRETGTKNEGKGTEGATEGVKARAFAAKRQREKETLRAREEETEIKSETEESWIHTLRSNLQLLKKESGMWELEQFCLHPHTASHPPPHGNAWGLRRTDRV